MKRKLSLLGLCALVCSITLTSFGQTKLSESDYSQIVYNYLDRQNARYNFSPADIEDLRISTETYSETTKITHLYLNQTYNDIRVYNAISSVAVKSNDVFYYANRFLNQVEDKVNTSTPSRPASAAVNALNSSMNLGITSLNLVSKEGNTFIFEAENISDRPIKAELVFFNIQDQLRLSWDVSVYLKDNTHWYSARVDAQTNEILEINDLILTCQFHDQHNEELHTMQRIESTNMFAEQPVVGDASQYNVFALPAESPNHGDREIVFNPASEEASPYGWHDTDGVDGAEFTITRGNNVLAREDRNGNNLGGYSPDGGDVLVFDYPLDFDQPPAGYEDAAITNLFYLNNMMHDIWFLHGFDESSNFQAKNYTGAPFDRDFVVADAQDGSGLNNATFGTPPDGQSPVMTMFLWSPSGPAIDPLTINNGVLAGVYDATPASFGGDLPTDPLTADLALPTDTTADIYDACQTITNPSQVNGKIAVIRRGECEFGSKGLAAQNAGAVAVIMVNNVAGATIVMGPGDFGGAVNIPMIMVSQSDGEDLITAIQGGATISATLQNNGPFNIDGDFDNGIIAHEYGHGISNRLTAGGLAVNCLFNDEQMGEGWSDWFGLMITMTEEDTAERVRGIGTFAVSQPTDGVGIRPAPYTTDTSVNNFTYANTNQGVSVPHGVGFVWATVLWDLTWAYIDKYGFDPDLYNGNGGNNRVMRLVIDGLKLQPCSPGFVDGRDALLAADLATTGGVDQCMIWEIFAARGLGFEADQGSSGDRADQVEDFSMPPANDPSLANCSSLSTDTFDIDTLSVYPNPTNSELFIETKQGLGAVRLTIVDLNGRVVLNKDVEIYDQLKLDISNLQDGMYFLNLENDTVSYNHKIIKN